MIVQLPYGKENLELSIPDRHFLQTLLPNEVQTDLVGTEEVIRALEHPIGTERLKDLVSPGQKVAIVTSDITRPLPSYLVLPPVLKELNRGGISDSDTEKTIFLDDLRLEENLCLSQRQESMGITFPSEKQISRIRRCMEELKIQLKLKEYPKKLGSLECHLAEILRAYRHRYPQTGTATTAVSPTPTGSRTTGQGRCDLP